MWVSAFKHVWMDFNVCGYVFRACGRVMIDLNVCGRVVRDFTACGCVVIDMWACHH